MRYGVGVVFFCGLSGELAVVRPSLADWPPPRHILLGVGAYSVIAGVLYLTQSTGLSLAGQAGFLLLFTTQIPLAATAYLRETRTRELRAEAVAARG
ncbi:hypothetical protein DFP74_3760 [Nocardiopsis sp. Huas11]|nr:hypothetical protein DFP74_3760 [Nocardiopsis sp. Huas11]